VSKQLRSLDIVPCYTLSLLSPPFLPYQGSILAFSGQMVYSLDMIDLVLFEIEAFSLG
jgi:hypothetical protein